MEIRSGIFDEIHVQEISDSTFCGKIELWRNKKGPVELATGPL
jgi:hypothetical protein